MKNKSENLNEISTQFNLVMKEVENEQESYWNSLSKDDQLKAFCAVVRRIYKGEIEDRGTYRWVLYDVFGFGPESYAQAQLAGYLTIHNSILDSEDERMLLKTFATNAGIKNPEEAVHNFYMNNL